ncbi:MAG: alpha/beta fold hydrolase [Acidimicrobiia bacterium]
MGAPTARFVRTRTRDDVVLHGALVDTGGTDGVLAVHGAWGNFYKTPVHDLLEPAARRGWSAASLNTRGHDLGTLGDGEPCIGFMRDLFEQAPIDLDAAAGVLRDAGVARILVVAHSYGSHKVAYWMADERPADVRGLAMVSPAPLLDDGARWFVEGALEHHIARAAAAVAAGEPHRLIVLSSSAPVPVVAEAATVLSTWRPGTNADTMRWAHAIDVPVLVTVGGREPSPYRRRAEEIAAALPDAELVVVDDDHYYGRTRPELAATVLDWAERRAVLGPPTT